MTLVEAYLEIARRVDGATLMREALAATSVGPVHVLAIGKVAFPMWQGLLDVVGLDQVMSGLLIAPASRCPTSPGLPARVRALVADHPQPSPRSLEAGRAALAFVGALGPTDHLLVLLSGGGSSLLAAPAGDLELEDKRATVEMVARAGATIAELNTVRKHLSAIKGGHLALATCARTTVLALSDVVGDDPSTIASGPFSPDPTTFAEALSLVRRWAPSAPPRALAWLAQGAAGEIAETPKPGDRRLGHVRYQVIAGPDRVAAEARLVVGADAADAPLAVNTEEPVPTLAAAYVERARRNTGRQRTLVGNGEPSIVVAGDGRGGRCTHLALLVARGIAGLPGVSFLAAGTDDRDGNTDAAGAVVDGTTWPRALAAGLDPEAALARSDSARSLDALGCLVRGPGTSNLLDVHLLRVGGASESHGRS